MEDRATQAYFDTFTPHFSPTRFEFALSFLREHAAPDAKLIDIGCGDGATLWLIRERAGISDLTGMDISESYLEQTAAQVGCHTILGSILDRDFVARHAETYDFCVLGAVLHHLIGSSRRASRRAAAECLRNATLLLKPGGYLIVFEPAHGPSFLMTAIFYLKKVFGSVYKRRIEIGQKWANLGQPIVSYYTPSELDEMTASLGKTRMIARTVVDQSRMGFVIRRVGLGLVLQNAETSQAA